MYLLETLEWEPEAFSMPSLQHWENVQKGSWAEETYANDAYESNWKVHCKYEIKSQLPLYLNSYES
jgi:hypothetical protein